MQTITKFRVADYEFEDENKALIFEGFLSEVESCNKILKRAIDKGCSFANGGGYIQHDYIQVDRFTNKIYELIKNYYSKDLAEKFKTRPKGIVGRYLDDDGSPIARELYKLWERLCCITDNYREWGQPYYALNPNAGEQVEWKNVE